MKTAFVTGVTSGFGKAFALRLAKLGYRLIVTGRRADRLEALAEQIVQTYNVEIQTLCFDVRNQIACQKAIESLPDKFKYIDLLVNNAGLAAGASPFQESDMDDYERMIDTNVKGLLYVTKLIVPGMIARNKGQIVNISSIAGIEVYPNGSAYCASKHAVNAITKGLRIDLLKHNIRVGSISPGMVETEFSIVRYHGDQDKAKAVYAGIVPLNAEDIADALEFMVTRPEHVSINDIQINPSQQANTYLVNRI
ncbi:MAG: NAD(P)-dependent oxidoreductase [Porphyromonadaceae bacterium CG2_30_38_12]|nr:MAG: NAD(P)-dependent oxidoreductase [Porphyromonadaceae bacterium CG2_30_38_12]